MPSDLALEYAVERYPARIAWCTAGTNAALTPRINVVSNFTPTQRTPSYLLVAGLLAAAVQTTACTFDPPGPGFVAGADAGSRLDRNRFDECLAGVDDCHELAPCVDLPSGFSCGSCPAGYSDDSSDGRQCNDIDECALDIDNCDADRPCTNTIGGFSCGFCTDGFVNANDVCVDVDECATDNGGCGDPNSFSCTNITGEAPTCADINECTEGTATCDPLKDCTNIVGGFTCGPCPSGYLEDPIDGHCFDFNECANGPLFHDCAAGTETCVNTIGGYICVPL